MGSHFHVLGKRNTSILFILAPATSLALNDWDDRSSYMYKSDSSLCQHFLYWLSVKRNKTLSYLLRKVLFWKMLMLHRKSSSI